MRFEKGSKVEVFNTKEFPSGEWRRAVIVSGNGHSYTVKYNRSRETNNESVVHNVSSKAIRPLPPPVSHVEGWKAGDVVEVFDDSSWKIATVLKVMNGNLYFIRLLGSSKQFQIPKVNIRVRQCWQDEQWVLIRKASVCSEVTKSDFLPVKNKSCFQESYNMSAQTLKRASHSYSYAESWTGNANNTTEIDQDGENPFIVRKKIDAFSYPREIPGKSKTYTHAPFNNRMNRHYVVVREKSSCVAECSHLNTEGNDSDPEDFSVGGNAESFDLRGDEEEECSYGVAARIHFLELHAYRCTLEAFYASGPLSWDQEALLTNLRLSLHISNDEHLMEIRKLISGTR